MGKKAKKLVIVGLGETAQLAYEYFTYDSEYEVIAFSADDRYCTQQDFCNLPVVKMSAVPQQFSPVDVSIFVAVSSGRLNRGRAELYLKVKSLGYQCASYISSRAFVWRNVEIGENCFILENNTLQPFTRVENNVTMWSGNHLGHRSVIKSHCFISSHVVISGFCEIGEYTFVGVNASVADHVTIAKDNFIAMTAVVTKDTVENGMYIGSPAKIRENLPASKYCRV